jgi:hypothetical protein
MDGHHEMGPETPPTPEVVPDFSFPIETGQIQELPTETEVEIDITTEEPVPETDEVRKRPFQIYASFSEVFQPGGNPEQTDTGEEDEPTWWEILRSINGEDEDEIDDGAEDKIRAVEVDPNETVEDEPDDNESNDLDGQDEAEEVEITESDDPNTEINLENDSPQKQTNDSVVEAPDAPTPPEPVEASVDAEEASVEISAEAVEPLEETSDIAEPTEVEEHKTEGLKVQEMPEEPAEPSPEEVEVIVEKEIAPPKEVEIIDAVIVDETESDIDGEETEETIEDSAESPQTVEAEPIQEEVKLEDENIQQNEPVAPETPPVTSRKPWSPTSPKPEATEEKAFEEVEPQDDPELVEQTDEIPVTEPIAEAAEVPNTPEIPRITEGRELPKVSEIIPPAESVRETLWSGAAVVGSTVGSSIASLFLAPTQRYETTGVSVARTSRFNDKKPTHYNVTVKRAGSNRTATIRVRASDPKVAERRAKSFRSLTPWNRFRIAFRTN